MTSFHNQREIHHQIGIQKAARDVYNITHAVPNKRQRFDDEDQNSQRYLDEAIRERLAFPEMSTRRRNIDNPHYQSCQWIFDLPEYQQWESESSGLLWIKGKPGAGKSTLMSHIYTALLEKTISSDDSIHLEFFFTARGAPLQHSRLGMLRSLTNQLFYHDVGSRAALRKSYLYNHASFGNLKWEWHVPELEKMFTEMILSSAQHRQITILVDALDEAGEEVARDIARYFHALTRQVREQPAKAKICISCRHYPVPSTRGAVEIHVEKHNLRGIASFVEYYLHDQIDEKCEATGDADEIEKWRTLLKTVNSMADGVFQWARMVLPLLEKRICDGDLPDEIQGWLRHVTTNLDQVYDFILEQVIDPSYRPSSLRLFQWVALAFRPLTVTELRYALAAQDIVADPLPQPTGCLVPGHISTDKSMKDRIQSWSGGLLEVINSEKPGVEVVQPIHLSVNSFLHKRGLQYLARYKQDPNGSSVTVTDGANIEAETVIAQCHGEIYRSCLKYLAAESRNISELRDSSKSVWVKSGTKKLSSSIPLALYAAPYVLDHAVEAKGIRDQDSEKEVRILECAIGPLAVTYETYDKYSKKRIYVGTSPLHVAALANLIDLASFLLGNGANVCSIDTRNQTALHVASGNGHIEMVETLVCAGADIHATTIYHTSALEIAASEGHTQVFSYLLDRGASINGTPSRGGALYCAAEAGKTAIVKLCIKARAEVNAQGGYYGNALQAASGSGRIETVQLLLEAGAEVNAQGGEYGNALQAASGSGSIETVRLLLEAGAEVNAQGGEYGNALQAASGFGRIETVRLLLEAGAEVNAQGGESGNALQAASGSGRIEIVQLLLEAGAEVNAQGGESGNALQAASVFGRIEIVQLLLEAGAEVNAQGGFSGNALQAASESGRIEIVQLLLEAGAEVNA